MQNVQLYMGADGVKQVYELSLEAKELAIMCLSSDYEQVVGDFFDAEYAPRLYGRLKTRELVPDTQENRAFAKSKDGKLNTVRFVKASSETDLLISSEWVGLVRFGKNPYALVIRDAELVKSYQAQYELMWQAAQA